MTVFDQRGQHVQTQINIANVRDMLNESGAEPDLKEQLSQLMEQLNQALAQVPQDKAKEAEAVAKTAENLVQTATEEDPNKPMLEITGEGLKKAAENLAAVTPAAVGIATQIVAAVLKLAA